jgi:outer membrane protein assembly factor BamB
MTEISNPSAGQRHDRPARLPESVVASTLRVAGWFCVVVALAMLVSHFRVAPHDPLSSPALEQKKEQLAREPANETLKEEIRQLDLAIRQRYFRHVAFVQTGGWLLAGGLIVFLLAARHLAVRRRQVHLPQPRPIASGTGKQVGPGRWSVAGVGALTALVMLGVAGTVRTWVPATPDELARFLAGDKGDTDTVAALEEWLNQWPRFRGPRGDGVAFNTALPTGWDGTTGDGILWKSEILLPGYNSPIVWRDRVFLAGGTESERAVWCHDTRDGRLLWRTAVPPMTAPPGGRLDVLDYTGYAASTMATDGRRVFAIFATGELVAFDFDGRVLWSRHLGVPDNMYGYASSLHAEPGWLIVQYDQGSPDDGKSRLYALEPATGTVRWEQRRAVPDSWSSPVVLDIAGRRQVVVQGEPWVMGYDLASGHELWRVDCLGADVAPSPVYTGGLLFVVDPHRSILAIRPDGEGDITESHLVWREDEGAPDITSPVSDGSLLFNVSTFGTLTCHDTRTGEALAERQLDLEFNASPILVGDRLLYVAVSGTALILAANPTLEELARMELGEKVHATPALLANRLYIRGDEHLFAIGTAGTLVAGFGSEIAHGN